MPRGRLAFWVAAAPLFLHCGARTPLPVDTCLREGEIETCQNACGLGTRTCLSGRWQACQVAPVERSCANDCGEGVQACTEGQWQACVVPPAERACENDCGTGIEQCRDGAWTDCEVAPVERACSNDCGTGVQRCSDNSWSACDVPPQTRACATVCGDGVEHCVDGRWLACDAPRPKPPRLRATVRDFMDDHPDFEGDDTGLDLGIVAPELGEDGKPIYAGSPTTFTTSGRENFDQWYRDVPGVNLATEIEIPLIERGQSGIYHYDGRDFFPIDGQAFGNQGRRHNYHFTLELETKFRYVGGEVFTFTGDDDLWVFINRRLAIDLGGLHPRQTRTADIDALARALAIEPGGIYPLHMFFAERHTVDSNFEIETTIAEFDECD